MSSPGPSRPSSNGRGASSAGVPARRIRDLDLPATDAFVDVPRPAAPSIGVILWRQRWIVLAAAAISLAAGVLYLARATPIYESSSVVYVQQSGPKIVGEMMASGQRTNGYIVTQCQVLTSTAILKAALAQPGIERLPSLRDSRNPVGQLKSMLDAQPDKAGELISLTCQSPDRDDAARIANAVVAAYIDYVGAAHRSTAIEVLRVMQHEADTLSASLRTTHDAMLRLKRETPDLVTLAERSTTPVAVRMSQLNEALTQAQLRQLDLRTALAQAQPLRQDPYQLKRVLDAFGLTADNVPAVDPALLGEYRQLRLQADELMHRLGPKHDSVAAAQRQVARVESELADATRASAEGLYALLQQAATANDAKVGDLQREVQAVRGSSVDLNVKQVEYEQLAQDAQRLERSLDLLDARMKDINVTEDVGALNVSVLETAEPGTSPVRPVRGRTLVMSLMAGLMLGVGFALLRDTLDHRLRSVEEITDTLDVPVLGSIPHIAGRRVSATDRGRFVQSMPRSAVAEAFRTLRTAIFFGIPAGTAGKTLLVSSPAPGDGKSTTASNLAIAFAQAGRRVLLIDADCRRPAQARIWNVPATPGLTDVLTGRSTLSAAIQSTSAERLWLLPAGEIPANPAELLDSEDFRSLLARVAEQYDQVILDSPPIVPVTDARILAAVADATVLVLRAERSTRRLADHARDALATVGARLIGVVVSDVPRGNHSYGYGYSAAGRYGYAPVQVDVGRSTNGHANGDGAERERVAGELMSDAPTKRA